MEEIDMMTATVEKLPDKPIIVVTIKGQLTVDVARSVYTQIAGIAKDIEGPIFRITDARKQETTFPEMMKIIKEVHPALPPTSEYRICLLDEKNLQCLPGTHCRKNNLVA